MVLRRIKVSQLFKNSLCGSFNLQKYFSTSGSCPNITSSLSFQAISVSLKYFISFLILVFSSFLPLSKGPISSGTLFGFSYPSRFSVSLSVPGSGSALHSTGFIISCLSCPFSQNSVSNILFSLNNFKIPVSAISMKNKPRFFFSLSEDFPGQWISTIYWN